MKKALLIILAFVPSFLIGQAQVKPKYEVEIKIPGRVGYMYDKLIQDERGFLTGGVYSSGGMTGLSRGFNRLFLYSQEMEFQYSVQLKVTHMVDYVIKPKKLNSTKDSLNLEIRYVLTKQKSQAGEKDYSYDVHYDHIEMTVPFEKPVNMDFLKHSFPDVQPIALFHLIVPNAKEDSIKTAQKLTYHNKSTDINKVLNESLEKSQMPKSDFKLSAEFIRINADAKRIVLKKNPERLKRNQFTLQQKNSVCQFYYGAIVADFSFYDTEKEKILLGSGNKMRNLFTSTSYSLELIPVMAEKNVYTFDLIATVVIGTGEVSYRKQISMKKGEKLRLEIPEMEWNFEDTIDGKKVTFNSANDYYKHYKDFIIVSFEK